MKQSVWIACYRYFAAHRKTCFVLLAVVFLGLVALALRLQYQEDITDFLPFDTTYKTATTAYQESATQNRVVVIAQTQLPQVDSLIQATHAYFTLLQQNDTLHQIAHFQEQVDMEAFDTPEIVPVVKKGDAMFLELFHGRTLAFKDMALSILPYLMKTSAKKNGLDKEIVILTATSGDTGKAALEGFANVEGTRIMVFFPEDGVSPVQKLQMNTQEGANTCVVGIKGNFDDAQSAVKSIFTDKELEKELDEKGFQFSSANSINIGRLVPQIVYYFWAYLNAVKLGEVKAGEELIYPP